MAEAFLKKFAADRFEVYSAGLEPVGIHPLTTKVMNELAIDLTGQSSKGVGQFLGKLSVHFAIFVCDRAEARCPTLWPWALNPLSWPFDDPVACEGTEEERLEKFRQVRNQIEGKIRTWLTELSVSR
jgi:arsenate reductase